MVWVFLWCKHIVFAYNSSGSWITKMLVTFVKHVVNIRPIYPIPRSFVNMRITHTYLCLLQYFIYMYEQHSMLKWLINLEIVLLDYFGLDYILICLSWFLNVARPRLTSALAIYIEIISPLMGKLEFMHLSHYLLIYLLFFILSLWRINSPPFYVLHSYLP